MRHLLALVLLTACSGTADTEETDTTETDAPACETVADGVYTTSGNCFMMTMSASITMDAATCSFVISDWSMNHGGEPETGAVDGADVTLAGGDWDGCTGTIDGSSITGTCPDDCAWDFTLQE